MPVFSCLFLHAVSHAADYQRTDGPGLPVALTFSHYFSRCAAAAAATVESVEIAVPTITEGVAPPEELPLPSEAVFGCLSLLFGTFLRVVMEVWEIEGCLSQMRARKGSHQPIVLLWLDAFAFCACVTGSMCAFSPLASVCILLMLLAHPCRSTPFCPFRLPMHPCTHPCIHALMHYVPMQARRTRWHLA